MTKSLIIFLVGPSGVGKTTARKFITQKYSNICYLPSFTTRLPRDCEINGVDYFFIPRIEFENYIEQDIFVEWEEHFGELYGITHQLLEKTLLSGGIFIKEIAIYGFKQFLQYTHKAKLNSNCIRTIFLMPSNIQNLIARIKNRAANNIEYRISNIHAELETSQKCDMIVHSIEDNIDALCKSVENNIFMFINT